MRKLILAILFGTFFGVLMNLLIGFDSIVGVHLVSTGYFVWYTWPGVLLGIFVALLYLERKA